MSKITPFLWFDNNAQEAAEFYISVFKESRMINATPMLVTFELNGQEFMALNGGPMFKFNESISFFVECKDQEEVDYYWEKLSAVPASEQCGWLKDKFGLSWQIVPKQLNELLSAHPDKNKQIMDVMLKMKKMVVADLENAAK